MKKKLLILFLVLVTVISALTVPVTAGGSDTIKSCLNVSMDNTDASGHGYTWDNIECVFVMDGLKINTTDMYGIMLPANSKVEIKGDNYITAASYGIHCLSNVEFYGSGTLTIVAAEAGVICVSTKPSDNARFKSGNIIFKDTKIGIYSENAKLSFTGAKIDIKASERSIHANNLQMTGGKMDLNGGIYAKGAVDITDTTLSITSDSKAIEALGNVSIVGKTVLAGENTSTLAAVDSYGAEACLRVTPQDKKGAPSLLFGDGVSPVWDYVIFAAVALAAVAVIAIPVAIKYKKTAKLIALSEQNQKEKGKKNSK